MTADEIMGMRGLEAGPGGITPGEMLVFIAGHRPILGTQTVYLLDAELRRRSTIPATNAEARKDDLAERLGAYV
jgi:type IV secretion system protein VirD4